MTDRDSMQRLEALADDVGVRLLERGESVAIGEGACGGLLSAALVGVPNASRFFVAGAVLYTHPAFEHTLGDARYGLRGLQGGSGDFSLVVARAVRDKYGSTWALGESGASGPSGNRYGDPPAMRRWPWPGRSRTRAWSRPVCPTDGRTCACLPSRPWSCSWGRSPTDERGFGGARSCYPADGQAGSISFEGGGPELDVTTLAVGVSAAITGWI